jgi:hypothetical protein
MSAFALAEERKRQAAAEEAVEAACRAAEASAREEAAAGVCDVALGRAIEEAKVAQQDAIRAGWSAQRAEHDAKVRHQR